MQELRDYVVQLLKQNKCKTPKTLEKTCYSFVENIQNEYDEDIEEIYKHYIYEHVGIIIELSKRKNDEVNLKAYLEDLKKGISGWDSIVYKSLRENESIDYKDLIEGLKIEKGEFTCKNKNC